MSAFLRRSAQFRRLYLASRQIFRFSNVNKNCELLASIPEVQQCAYGSSMVFQRNVAKIAHEYENGELQRNFDALSPDLFIDKMLSKIDADAKKFGYVLKRDVDAVFSRVVKSGIVSSIQSLYLIRCCGVLLCNEQPAQRIVMVNEVWSQLQELDVPIDASHYNALLKSYLENEHKFSPHEILAQMENKGVVPNRVTYQRIIEKYCCDGDLTGASAILEHMKEKDLPINESIFNSLVLGHARAKDMQGAVNMLDVMRKSKLEPSSETYAALACGYAENGDIEGFRNTLSQAEEKQVSFSDKNYLQMISSLASSGDTQCIDEIMPMVNLRQHKPEAVNTAMILISRGLEDGAYKIITSIISELAYTKVIYPFMKALVGKGTSLEKMLCICEDLFSKGLYENAYEDALKVTMLYGETDNAFEVYKEMRKVGRPIRCHYFWPIFAAYGKKGNVEGIWATLKFMSDMALPADADTYLDYILPHMSTSNPDEIIAKVKEFGQSGETVTDSLFLYFCVSGQLKAAADFCRDYEIRCSIGVVTSALVSTQSMDAEPIVMILKHFREKNLDPNQNNDVFGMFLNRLLYQHHSNIPLIEHYLREYNDQKVKISPAFVETLCSHLKTLAPELVRLVLNLEMNVVRDEHMDTDFIHPAQMTLEQLEKRLADVKESGGNVRPLLRHLFTHYCRLKDLDHALEMKAEMDAINFTYGPAAYALLVNLYVSYNNLTEAMKYKKEIDEQFPHFKLDAAKAIDYITLMVKSEKFDEAFEMIENEAKDWVSPRYEDLLLTSIRKLLHAAADLGNVEITQKLFQILVQDLKFVPVHHTILDSLVKVHIVKNDSDAAIEEYRKQVVNHNVFPSRNFLFKKFITSKDPERLQKVVDISTTYGGKEIALHELAAAFIDSGCVQEARKVIQTLGTRADAKLLDVICYRFVKQDKVLELENFIGITKDLYHINREQLYTHLLNLYSQKNNYQAALEMWNTMQEECVQPSSSTLQRLAELLEKNNQTVPFIIPLSNGFQSNSNIMNLLDEKNDVELVVLLRSMKKGEIHSLTPDVFTKIVDFLVEKKFLKEIVDNVQVMSCILDKPSEILKPVARKYGEAGDVDALKLLYDCMPDFAHKYMHFNANFFEAHIFSGQPEALLDELEKNIGTPKNLFSLRGFLKLMNNYPEHLDRCIKLADSYFEKGQFDAPKMVVWLYHLINEKFEEAEELYKEHSLTFMKTDFPYVVLMQTVRNTQNENLGRKLVDLANETLKSNTKSRAYSCLLDVLVQKEKLEEAIALIKEAKNSGVPTEKFLHPTLVSLKKSLVEKNMPVPFIIPSEGEESGSSSSDSD